ncbi:magnesium transporter CorA family protein [Rhodoferax sp. PAMC 29310]|uniref:magnesium transporter CorA family protein n=1 Tax=Rhodoferax sp. PAMC 29310 TaxID=2822760 RepID=UPI001B33A57A|nr:magnesium transporter CorA family protein [Rhodoferax sp. PAMC 29310]
MRIFTINGHQVAEADDLAVLHEVRVPEQGFVWIACARHEFEASQGQIQAVLQSLAGTQLVDLHISDLLNKQLPSRYDYTSLYDVMVFRRLAAGSAESAPAPPPNAPARATKRSGPPILRRIDTSPVGFAVFDHVLLTVHPTDCAVRDAYAAKLLTAAAALTSHAGGARMPSGSADLMLRIINQMVDGFLELRRELTHQLDHWQTDLLNPKARFNNWGALLDARLSLHQLDEICEDQRAALQDWIEAIKTWPEAATPESQRERDLLQVRSRDVLEHIERVVHHVQRLEQSAETAVQMHFNAQSHRTNEIMRTLTVLTAVFLPLNLIAGIFGMNFEFIPLLHRSNGFWLAMSLMASTGLGLLIYFWRKRYIEHSSR